MQDIAAAAAFTPVQVADYCWVNEHLRISLERSSVACAGEEGIPTDELEIAADLYVGLQGFFRKHRDLQGRPLFITGESYGGKYVPAIGMAGHLHTHHVCRPRCPLGPFCPC